MTQGQTPHRAEILAISQALPCKVTTTEEHGYSTHDFVRLTNLGVVYSNPELTNHGMDPLNNARFRIVVTAVDEFTLQDPITFEPIDSSNYTPYTEGGKCNLIVHDYIYNPDE